MIKAQLSIAPTTRREQSEGGNGNQILHEPLELPTLHTRRTTAPFCRIQDSCDQGNPLKNKQHSPAKEEALWELLNDVATVAEEGNVSCAGTRGEKGVPWSPEQSKHGSASQLGLPSGAHKPGAGSIKPNIRES